MASVLVGYDLNKPETSQDYKALINAIKGLGVWWHCLDSTWIIKTELTTVQIRDRLRAHLDINDELLVAKLTGEAAWVGFNDECSKWLSGNL
jgi:hypothetical protein